MEKGLRLRGVGGERVEGVGERAEAEGYVDTPGWPPTWAWASGRGSPWGHVGLWLLYQNPLLLLCPKGSFPFILSSQEDEGNSKDHLCLTHAYRVLFSEKRFTILGVSSLFLFFVFFFLNSWNKNISFN